MTDDLEVLGLSLRYGASFALTDVSMSLGSARLGAIVGPNGAGKSSLLRVLAGLVAPNAGSVTIAGVDPRRAGARQRARLVGYLPQRESVHLPFTVLDLVLMARFPFRGWFPIDRATDLDAAHLALDRTGTQDLAHRRLTTLSGGERQRVQIARVLAQEPRWLLLDEPAASLDLRHQVETWRLLSRLRDEGVSIVVVSHDLNLPGDHADQVIALHEGRVAARGTPSEILRAATLEPLYGTRLVEALVPERDLPFLFPAR